MLEFFGSASVDHDDEGASAVEYGLLVAAIAAIIILIVLAIGGQIQDGFHKTCDGLAANPHLSNTVAGTCAK